ncbi:unnamed protein product [Spirodela intermedia]|uniref:NAC domain-containing protein n=1 Tax=Spirodela intermedia TaxID=51605 RepID=A0A7I8ICT3_SPIIN|nr:unnamed protein product [Spirodela intermedia]CAA6655459.1 unnamed protein product [Spirodela intermedia]
MKKTLVFHAGRAPKGQRTNWVMHEYRLHDAHLAAAALPQDGFVVCRIFQKRGPGPQNGAQYGAPLPVEDEWDESELPAIKEECGGEGSNSIVFSNPLPAEIGDDDDDLNADQGDEDQKPVLLLITGGHGGDLNDCHEQELSNVVDGSTEGRELQEGDHNTDQRRSHAVLKDGYLELDDFADSVGANNQEDAAAYPGEIIHNHEDSCKEDLNDVKEYFALNDESDDDDDLSRQFSETGGDKRFLALGDLAGSEPHGCSSGEAADDGLVYFDATSHYPHGDRDFSSGMNCFLDATMGGENDLMDEIMAYFDATENLQPSDLDIGSGASSANQPGLAPVVGQKFPIVF